MAISVIIPTYKSPDALELCLWSVTKGQKNKNQIIVVVDGFYDINKDVLEKYAKSIEILNLEQNVGLCRGTNLGVYNATNELILIVNDDNVFPQDWDTKLEAHYKKYSQNEPDICISPNQIEPYPSMFNQFVIKDLGTNPKRFDIEAFWRYERTLSNLKPNNMGSTLPIFMSKINYLKLGGWDENYEEGMVSDWDFFLKCELAKFRMLRVYDVNFYHFASVSVNGEKRQIAEQNGHAYAKYKWGEYIKHNSANNTKFL